MPKSEKRSSYHGDDRPFVLSLKDERSTIHMVGGKGASLARAYTAGFQVPPAFLITTSAYDYFIGAAGIQIWIQEQLHQGELTDPAVLTRISDRIRARFASLTLPADLRRSILDAYRREGEQPVAVRSSATAEDLPEASFAGQQDTFLNVQGEQALLKAVIECWSSLWTARAIGYRARNRIDQEEVRLGIVVQEMIPSDTSGVLFTANPLTGRRSEMVIDATTGLGEALVSGLVEPDHYVVDAATGWILSKEVGAKAKVIRSRPGGGIETSERDAESKFALSTGELARLIDLGRRIAAHYGSPQDIEWAFSEGKLYLLQSRPITSLFPLPNRGDSEDLHLFFSFASVQGLLDPISPLGQETIRLIFAGGARLFGYEVDHRTQRPVVSAGERLWVDMTPLLRSPIGSRILRTLLPAIDPAAAAALDEIQERIPVTGSVTRSIKNTIAPQGALVRRSLFRILRSWLWPDRSRRRALARTDELVAAFREQAEQSHSLAERIDLHQRIGLTAFYTLIPDVAIRVVPGLLSLAILARLAQRLEGDLDSASADVLTITRGLPHNVTTQMDLDLWHSARRIQYDRAAAEMVRKSKPSGLAWRYRMGEMSGLLYDEVRSFLDRYGARAIGEIDVGRVRWQEDPSQIFRMIQDYLQIKDPDLAPDAVFRRGEEESAAAIERLANAARSLPHGEWLIRFLAKRVRSLAGLRELPKFTIIRLLGISRDGLLQSGEELVAQGILDRPDDLFFLSIDELKVLAQGAPGEWGRLIEWRREQVERERRRQMIPRLMLSDGTAYYEGIEDDDAPGTLQGSPVSPGVVEGLVRVVLDPHEARLESGEIMVCPGTDPAWTPLFLTAGGLVTEVGGMMTHGSVVAREYGIPAVVGVSRATSRLQTGQRVRLDGSQGRITLLEDE